MPVQISISIAALLVVVILTTTAPISSAQVSDPNCFGTAGTVNHGPNIRPASFATISLGVILVEFTDRLQYTGGSRPNGYLKQDVTICLIDTNNS